MRDCTDNFYFQEKPTASVTTISTKKKKKQKKPIACWLDAVLSAAYISFVFGDTKT